MKTREDIQPLIQRAIDDEVASVRLKAVDIVAPTPATTATLVPGVAWIVAAVLVAVIVGAIWRQDAEQRAAAPSTPAAASPSVGAATSTPIVSSAPGSPASPSAPAGCGAVEVGQIAVCPGAGPVGTHVRIDGRNCADSGAYVQLVLVGNPGETDGTVGSYSLPTVVPDASGRFVVEFTVPAVLDTVHGEGSGPTRPGAYRIISKPLYCGAKFSVTRA